MISVGFIWSIYKNPHFHPSPLVFFQGPAQFRFHLDRYFCFSTTPGYYSDCGFLKVHGDAFIWKRFFIYYPCGFYLGYGFTKIPGDVFIPPMCTIQQHRVNRRGCLSLGLPEVWCPLVLRLFTKVYSRSCNPKTEDKITELANVHK